MIVDTSAILAIVKAEPERAALVDALRGTETKRMSAGTCLELGIVVRRSGDPVVQRRVAELLEVLDVRVEAFTAEHAALALNAYADFGKGSGHPAGLNFGDCFAYTLAQVAREPLLYKGEDFGHTDVPSAL